MDAERRDDLPPTITGWYACMDTRRLITIELVARMPPETDCFDLGGFSHGSAYAGLSPRAVAEYLDSLLLRIAHPDLYTALFAPDSRIVHGHHRADMDDHVLPGSITLQYFPGTLQGLDIRSYLRNELDLHFFGPSPPT